MKKFVSRFFLTVICALFCPYLLSACTKFVQYAIVFSLPLLALLSDYMRFVNKVIANDERPDEVTSGSFYTAKFKSSFGLFFRFGSADFFKKSKLRGRTVAIVLCGLLGASMPAIMESCQLYHEGLGGFVYNEKAEYWVRAAYEQGNIAATRVLASMYEHGYGVPADCAKAVSLYEKAAAANDSQSMVILATLYLDGKCLDKDLGKGISLLKKAAKLGSKDAKDILAIVNEREFGVPADCATAVNLYEKAAAANDSQAMFVLATMYFDGKCVKKDVVKGVSLLEKSSALGHKDACYELGYVFEHGLAGKIDYDKSAYFYQSAYDQGVVKAAGILGYFYQNGIGVPVDCEQAEKLYKVAVDNDDAQAMLNLADMYFQGKCVAKNDDMGVVLLENASKLGNKDAALLLGYCYEHGVGVDRDVARAQKIYLKLAKDGFSRGQVNLAVVLFSLGGYENNVEGLKWVNKAVAQGDPNALRLLRDFQENNPNYYDK